MLQQLFNKVNRERGSAGFTLIELLIVVVIIGILAAIAIPQFSSTKDKAYLASMKADLRNLATEQEVYFADNNQYMPAGDPSGSFESSDGVTVQITDGGSQSGWSATAEHGALPGDPDCGIFFGSSTFPTISASGGWSQPASTTAGAPYCQEK